MKRIFVLFAVLLLLAGCGGKNMTLKDVYSLPPLGESGQEKGPYDVLLIPMNPILEVASRYGVRQDLYLGGEDKAHPEKLSSENYLGTKLFWEGSWRILVIDYGNKIDMARKGYVGSRDRDGQLHQYGLDGKTVYGQFEERFSWEKIKSLRDSGVVRLEVVPGDGNDELIVKTFAQIAEQVKKLHLPDLGERVLKKIGTITNEHLFLALASNFEQFFMFFGVQYFPLIMEIAGVGPSDGPHLEQAVVTNYDLGKVMADEVGPIKRAIKERDSQISAKYLELLAEYNRALEKQKALQLEYQRKLGGVK